jgi:flagellar biosynthesis protein FlhB
MIGEFVLSHTSARLVYVLSSISHSKLLIKPFANHVVGFFTLKVKSNSFSRDCVYSMSHEISDAFSAAITNTLSILSSTVVPLIIDTPTNTSSKNIFQGKNMYHSASSS